MNRTGGLIPGRLQGELGGSRRGRPASPAQLLAPWRAWLPFYPRACSQQGPWRGEGVATRGCRHTGLPLWPYLHALQQLAFQAGRDPDLEKQCPGVGRDS